MNTIVPFNFNGAEIRAITKDGEPWFVAFDVCAILEIGNVSEALRGLDDDELTSVVLMSGGQNRNYKAVNESGLYALVFKSRKPEAKAFKKWVTSEVLPQIRKTGGYHLPQTFPEALRLLADAAEQNEALKLTVAAQQPAVEYVERFVKAEGLFGIRETAKILGLQQNAFVAMCKEKGVLFHENGTLQAYAEWMDKGHFKIKTGEANGHAFKQLRFTSSGIEWVRRRLNIAALLGESQQAA